MIKQLIRMMSSCSCHSKPAPRKPTRSQPSARSCKLPHCARVGRKVVYVKRNNGGVRRTKAVMRPRHNRKAVA